MCDPTEGGLVGIALELDGQSPQGGILKIIATYLQGAWTINFILLTVHS